MKKFPVPPLLALGVVAIVLLVIADNPSATVYAGPPDEPSPPPPDEPPAPNGEPPAAPPAAPGDSSLEELQLGATVSLEQGMQYLAVVHLTGAEAAFGDANDVKKTLEEIGFSNVAVWQTGPPAYFPDRQPFRTGTTFWAQGRYQGASGAVAKPSEIAHAWVNRGTPVG